MKEVKKTKYEVVNKDNFEGISSKSIKPPKNEKEFKEATKNLYDVELGVECFAYPKGAFSDDSYSCKYEIVGDQDEYKKGKIYQLWEKKYSQYDGLKQLLDVTFGELSCGGVAGRHYGQTTCDKKIWDRVKKWDKDNSKKVVKSALKQHNNLVEIFGVNPFN